MSKKIPTTFKSFEHTYYLDDNVFKMVNNLEKENKQLKEKIDNVIEYINERTELSAGLYTDYCDAMSREELLEILGDKENE